MQLLEELARGGKLICPETRSPVAVVDDRVVSANGREFGRLPGPLNFLGSRLETVDPSEVPAGEVARVRAHLELPQGEGIDAEIATALAATGTRFADAHLSAEARILAERFCMAPLELAARPAVPVLTAVARVPPASECLLEHLSDTIGERLTAGTEVFRSVRVRNGGKALLPCADAAGLRIETLWVSSEGVAVPDTATSTGLPVDIDAGRELTLILRIRAPRASGRHRLLVRLAAGKESCEPFLDLPVETIACELPVFQYRYFGDILAYGPDHHVAALDVLEFVKERYGRSISALEIGGGVAPTGHSIAAHGHRVVSTDISHAQSILGTLYFTHKMPYLQEALAFVSCDGLDLPFADASFDGVVLFAAFHHFDNPLALLDEAKRVIHPDGFIYLGCENCVPDPADAEYRKELRRGINEQMWTLAELTRMFRIAKLKVARARVDFHSLKVALVRS